MENKAKKYFTVSFDDGITQDRKIIEIFRKHSFTGATFNINTGLCGVSWEWVGEVTGMPGLSHLRFTEDELKSGVYDGFDVIAHTLHHPSLKDYDDNIEMIISEVQTDADNIYKYTGVKPVGLAWPGGDTEWTDKTVELVVENTDIRFARCGNSSHSFALPEYFMKWYPTCSITDESVLTLAERFLSSPCEEDMLFYVWGHGYELDLFDKYGTLDKLIGMITDAENIEIVTNTQFYELFKDRIPSWKNKEKI